MRQRSAKLVVMNGNQFVGDAAMKDVQTNPNKEVSALDMVERSELAAMKDVQTNPNKEVSV